MSSSKQDVTSLLTEHFKYTPLTLLDDIINTVNEVVYRAVTAIEEGLTNADPVSLGFADESNFDERDADGNPLPPPSRVEIENGVHQLETLLQATVDKNFDKFEIFVLRNILTVDDELVPHIRLKHYEGLDLSDDPEEGASEPKVTVESLAQLRQQLTESRKLQAALRAEHARNDAYIKQLRNLISATTTTTTNDPPSASLAFLSEPQAARDMGVSLEGGATDPIQPQLRVNTEAAMKNLPEIKQLLAALKNKTDGEALRYGRRNVAGEERREYIETQIRRRFEREGLDLVSGPGSSLAQAQTSTGPRIGAEQVRSLENILESFQSVRQARRDTGGDDGGGDDGGVELREGGPTHDAADSSVQDQVMEED